MRFIAILTRFEPPETDPTIGLKDIVAIRQFGSVKRSREFAERFLRYMFASPTMRSRYSFLALYHVPSVSKPPRLVAQYQLDPPTPK